MYKYCAYTTHVKYTPSKLLTCCFCVQPAAGHKLASLQLSCSEALMHLPALWLQKGRIEIGDRKGVSCVPCIVYTCVYGIHPYTEFNEVNQTSLQYVYTFYTIVHTSYTLDYIVNTQCTGYNWSTSRFALEITNLNIKDNLHLSCHTEFLPLAISISLEHPWISNKWDPGTPNLLQRSLGMCNLDWHCKHLHLGYRGCTPDMFHSWCCRLPG